MTERLNGRVKLVSGDDFASEMKRRLKAAIRGSGSDLQFLLKQEAQGKIREEGAVWLGRLLANFEHRYERRGSKLVLVVYNDSEHAPYVEYGAEYGTEGPPVASLIPWVQYHLSGWELPEDAGPYPSADDVQESQRMLAASDGGQPVDAFAGVPDAVVDKAFWLQEHIKENGLDAVGFMDEAEEWARQNARRVVADNIDQSLAGM